MVKQQARPGVKAFKKKASNPKFKRERRATEVRMYPDVLKYLPFTVSPNRKKGWELIKEIGNDGGYVRATANETINVNDIVQLMGIVKAMQDAKAQGLLVVDTLFEGTENQETFAMITIQYSSFLKHYAGHNNRKDLIDMLERLVSFKCFWHFANGNVISTQFLHGFQLKEGQTELTLKIPNELLTYCDIKGWFIDLTNLRRLRMNTTKALSMYLTGNSGMEFYLSTLEKILDLRGVSRNNRITINAALDELVEKKEIVSWHVVKTEKGHKYVINRG